MVCSNKPDENPLSDVIDVNNQSIFIATYIKNNTLTFQNACLGILFLNKSTFLKLFGFLMNPEAKMPESRVAGTFRIKTVGRQRDYVPPNFNPDAPGTSRLTSTI
jgi:hypothetical protein